MVRGDFVCKFANVGGCSDGTAGARDNPCAEADSEELCPAGYLWCVAKSKRQKPSELSCFEDDAEWGGNETDTDACRLLDASKIKNYWCFPKLGIAVAMRAGTDSISWYIIVFPAGAMILLMIFSSVI